METPHIIVPKDGKKKIEFKNKSLVMIMNEFNLLSLRSLWDIRKIQRSLEVELVGPVSGLST